MIANRSIQNSNYPSDEESSDSSFGEGYRRRQADPQATAEELNVVLKQMIFRDCPHGFMSCEDLRQRYFEALQSETIEGWCLENNLSARSLQNLFSFRHLELENYQNFTNFLKSEFSSMIEQTNLTADILSERDSSKLIFSQIKKCVSRGIKRLRKGSRNSPTFNMCAQIDSDHHQSSNQWRLGVELAEILKRLPNYSQSPQGWGFLKNWIPSQDDYQVLSRNLDHRLKLFMKIYDHLIDYLGFSASFKSGRSQRGVLNEFREMFRTIVVQMLKVFLKIKHPKMFDKVEKAKIAVLRTLQNSSNQVKDGLKSAQIKIEKLSEDINSFDQIVDQLRSCKGSFKQIFSPKNLREMFDEQVQERLDLSGIGSNLREILLDKSYLYLEDFRMRTVRDVVGMFSENSEAIACQLAPIALEALKKEYLSPEESRDRLQRLKRSTKSASLLDYRLDDNTQVDIFIALLLIFPLNQRLLLGPSAKQRYHSYMETLITFAEGCFAIKVNRHTLEASKIDLIKEKDLMSREDKKQIQEAVELTWTFKTRLSNHQIIQAKLKLLSSRLKNNYYLKDPINCVYILMIFYLRLVKLASTDACLATNYPPQIDEVMGAMGLRSLFIELLGCLWPFKDVCRADHVMTQIENKFFLNKFFNNWLDQKRLTKSKTRRLKFDGVKPNKIYQISEKNEKILNMKRGYSCGQFALNGMMIDQLDVDIVRPIEDFNLKFLPKRVKNAGKRIPVKSFSTTLAISGFLSQEDDLDEVWKGVRAYNQYQETLTIRWNSGSIGVQTGLEFIGYTLLNAVESVFSAVIPSLGVRAEKREVVQYLEHHYRGRVFQEELERKRRQEEERRRREEMRRREEELARERARSQRRGFFGFLRNAVSMVVESKVVEWAVEAAGIGIKAARYVAGTLILAGAAADGASDIYIKAVFEAIKTGKALSFLVNTTDFLYRKPINIIGYSLGSVVTLHMLYDLAHYTQYGRVQDVCLMGSVIPENEFYEKLCMLIGEKGSVSGRIFVLYHEQDRVLNSFFGVKYCNDKENIGSERLNYSKMARTFRKHEEIPYGLSDHQLELFLLQKVINIDASDIFGLRNLPFYRRRLVHQAYPENSQIILERIGFGSHLQA